LPYFIEHHLAEIYRLEQQKSRDTLVAAYLEQAMLAPFGSIVLP